MGKVPGEVCAVWKGDRECGVDEGPEACVLVDEGPGGDGMLARSTDVEGGCGTI